MHAGQTVHPNAELLAAFSLGKLSGHDADVVARHLEGCDACRRAVDSAPPDSFLGLLRAAQPPVADATPAPSRVPADLLDGTLNPSAASVPGLPPALAAQTKYRIIRELGRGGMGVVYEAEHSQMRRRVALKVINPALLADADAVDRFHGEVVATAQMDHPNIARAYDFEQAADLHFLVMEFIEGRSLADLVHRKGPLSVAKACACVRQAALGLQHAFERGMIHRDIKPHNLMVTAKGVVKVLDFGLARARRRELGVGGRTQTGAFMGTPDYVAPEQATDASRADTRADIYSLGCTLFFLLTGRPPFAGETEVGMILAHLQREAPALREVCADAPAELSALAARMLAKDPAERPQTPREVAQALLPFCKVNTKDSATPASGSHTSIPADNDGMDRSDTRRTHPSTAVAMDPVVA